MIVPTTRGKSSGSLDSSSFYKWSAAHSAASEHAFICSKPLKDSYDNKYMKDASCNATLDAIDSGTGITHGTAWDGGRGYCSHAD